MKKRKLVIIGLDGVPYGLLKNFSDKGIMPNVRDLISKGIFKKINSTLPEVSCVAWSSIITGRNPAEHGIFGFTDLEKDTYKLCFPNFRDLKAPAFWTKYNKLRYVIINVPATYPATSLNGILISGFVAPLLEKSVYPSSLFGLLKKMRYRTDVDSKIAHTNMDSFMEDLFATLESHLKLYRYLWRKEKWDVFMFVFTGTDRLMHFLWNAYEEEGNKYHSAFLDYFKEIDKAIGEIKEELSKEDTLLIFSDHGFERLKQDIFINKILKEEGLLNIDNSSDFSGLDYSTKAFAQDPARIYINLKGKYFRGSVKISEKEKIMKKIENLFSSLNIDGKKVIKKIYRKEEIYRGPYLNSAPDLILLSERGFNLRASLSSQTISTNNIFTGKHTYDDAFFLPNNDLLLKQKENFSVVAVGKLIEKIILNFCH